ncbi:MAG: hypothetical protein HZB44_04530 [Actinobacteria bacterium]|nr:hypothetical protein [Actinomycetota bacterium]
MGAEEKRDVGRWLAALLFMAIAAIWLATSDFALIDRLQFVSSVPERAVSDGHELVQTFTATGENISRIDLVLVKSQQGPAGELNLRVVEVNEEPARELNPEAASAAGAAAEAPTSATTAPVKAPTLGTTIAETTFDTGSFDYTAIRTLEFEPVPLTPGRTYAFVLTSDDPEDSAIHPGSNPNDEYARGRLYIDGEPQKGDLYFAIFHSDGADGMLEKLEPWRPFPLSSPILLVALILTGAGAFGWLLWSVAGNLGDPEESTEEGVADIKV